MQAARPSNQPAATSLCPSLGLAHLEPGRSSHLFILFYLRCSNPGGYLHFLLLASSMREEEKWIPQEQRTWSALAFPCGCRKRRMWALENSMGLAHRLPWLDYHWQWEELTVPESLEFLVLTQHTPIQRPQLFETPDTRCDSYYRQNTWAPKRGEIRLETSLQMSNP